MEEDVLREEWAAQVQEQTKPLTRELARCSINIFLTQWFLGQSRNQALHAINVILELEKSLALLNENIRFLELQLMGNAIYDSTDGTDVSQQINDSCSSMHELLLHYIVGERLLESMSVRISLRSVITTSFAFA